MLKTLTSAEIDEGKDISLLFSTLSEESKTMGVIYLSACLLYTSDAADD